MAASVPYTVIINPGHFLAGISETEQFRVLKQFWERGKGFREKWSLVYLSGVLGGDEREDSYDEIGAAARSGLAALLVSRNLLPCGPGCDRARMIIHCFDSLPSGSNDRLNTTWLEQKQMVIRYYYQVYDKMPCAEVAYADIIGSGSSQRVIEHYQTAKNQLVALLIVKCAYGWHFKVPSRDNVDLRDLSTWPRHKGVFYKFVVPMIKFVITEMNPDMQLCVNDILDTNLSRVEDWMKQRLRSNGVWSHDLLEYRQGLPHGHRYGIGPQDRHVTKGVEYHFARLGSLIIPNYKLPYSVEKKEPHKVYVTREEYNNLYRGYDNLAVARYGVPKYP